MFSKKEQKDFLNNVKDLQSLSTDLTDEISIPSLEDKGKVRRLLIKYIQDNNMIIYGGSAQNLAVKRINPKGCFYEEGEIHDFDTYSSSPIQDALNICNLIYNEGFKDIMASEAIHIDTYTIKYAGIPICDLTYMPKYIIDNVNTYNVDGFRIIDPYFSYIDFMRMFSDPLSSSSFRWDKHFERFNLMQQYYPLEPKYNKLELDNSNQLNKDIKKIIKKFLSNNETCISVGLDCYNKYVDLTLKKSDKVPLNSYTIITSNYIIDTYYIFDLLKKKYKNKIIKKEKYPFFQFWDVCCEIYLDNQLIIKIFRNNNICIQYKEYKNIKYASFTTNLMWFMIENVYYKMYNKDCSKSPSIIERKTINDIYMKLLQNMIYMKELYLKKNKKSLLDNTLFQHFVLQCSGVPLSSNEIKKNTPYYRGFKYIPDNKIIKEMTKIYQNISGRYMNTKNELIDNDD